MSLIDQINKVTDESFEKWFERWYKKLNLETRIIKDAQKGFTSIKIYIKKEDENESYFGTKQSYYVRRLRDDRTVKFLKEKLGSGFQVEHKEQTREGKIFGLMIYRTSEWINISWKARAM
ncbi:hypothetical protein [Candidatus Enterococcus ikei]|uniref:Uncharacterized protein n=1 Tax=Candidatus Enterococcus ikei TaxID=2815326 RepID=A0ABS3GUK3_9ENTE|nr:hypothetical protein [Enterococcus sp. DIV0869a]MBO0438926.1 hypothetical protein [Enterococcus sp. DIV0869a]